MTNFTEWRIFLLLILVPIFTCSPTPDLRPDLVPDLDLNEASLISSMTTGVLDLLDSLRDTHGEQLSDVLKLLLERVKLQTVTEEEANAISGAIAFIDDPKVQEIMEVIGQVVSDMPMDEILSSAYDIEEDFVKSGPDELPEIEFTGDNRTYEISQLDMLIPKEETEGDSSDSKNRVKRKAVIDEERLLWKGAIIPYYIYEDHFSSAERHLIKNAMNHWAYYTCLEFREKRDTDFNSVLIQAQNANGDSGCFSSAGQIGGTQHLILGKGCRKLQIIIHEIGHAVGLYHEHSRTDRDEYIEILWQNIRSPFYFNEFQIRPSKHRLESQVPYDYRSVMHYGPKFCGKKVNGEKQETIRTKDEEYQKVIGKAKGLSFIDIKTVSLLYKCSDGCREKKCPGDGFIGKGCKCWCKGPNDRIPVVACTQEVTCPPPPIDMATYQVFHAELSTPLWEFPLEIPSGTRFRVDLADLRCGYDMTEISCYHGIWDLPLPTCQPDPCRIKADWIEDYHINLVPPEIITAFLQFNVTHDSKINLTCKSEPSRQYILECSYGNWTNEPLICPEIGGRCPVPEISDIDFFLEYKNTRLTADDTVKHGYVVQAICSPDLTLFYDDYQDVFETNMTCLDGRWIGDIPICPQPPVPCPEVQHGQIHEMLPFAYNVTCDNGYQLDIEKDSFRCDRNGTWFPIEPKCVPKDCVIPAYRKYRATIRNNDGAILSESSVVRSGETIDFKCRHGYIPGKLSLMCNAQRWNTPGGHLPLCTEVFCRSPPPIQGSSYSPHLPRYRFGDVLTINKCKGNLETIGPAEGRIECLADGSWSASFKCRKFCNGGQIEEVQFANKRVRAKPAKTSSSVQNVKKCRKKCIKAKKYLCLSYLYGFDSDRRRWVCQHFKVNPSKNNDLLEPKRSHYVFARNCVE